MCVSKFESKKQSKAMNHRVLSPELLDSLPAEHPDAVRSRRDLRLIDHFMGNSAWVLRQLRKRRSTPLHVLELGAGDGHLAQAGLARLPQSTQWTGLDLAPRPAGLPQRVFWQQGDFLATASPFPPSAKVLVGCLILHHFSGAQLRALGRKIQNSDLQELYFVEPYRHWLHLAQGQLTKVLRTSPVTDHDLPVSVRAGFRKTELPAALALWEGNWQWVETRSLLGGLRLRAWR